jgi:hypothetical protein
MVQTLLADFDGSWQTIAVLLVIAAILLKIVAWVCFLLSRGHKENLLRAHAWIGWSAYASMLIAVLILLMQ